MIDIAIEMVLLVGRDRDLRRLDVEFEVAAVDVVGAQLFQVGIELGARIAVGLAVPGEPAAGRQLEKIEQRRFAEHRGAGDADVLDLGGVAFGHREGDADAVAFQRRHRRHHLGAVEAAAQILALDFLFGTVYQRAVERQAFADAGVLQALGQRVLVELLQADEGDGGDDRAFIGNDDRHVAFDLDAHVLEQAGGEQRAQRGRALVVGVGVADAERQRGEHRAGIGALQAFNADVLQHEGA